MPELCDCDRRDHIDSPEGHCLNLSIAAEEHDDRDRARWSQCGCCMADCPDVHPTPTPGFFEPVPGSVTFAAEHVATLSAEDQARLRAREAAGGIRILPRAEMVPEPMRAALRLSKDEDET